MEANKVETENLNAANGLQNRSMITRRTRNNTTGNVIEGKDQENVSKVRQEPEAEQSFTEEATTKHNGSSKTEAKQQILTTNGNSSTPRRKKDPLANLHSNLSPKYIGFTTPPTQLDSSNSEETLRSLRRRHQQQHHHNISNNSDTSLSKDTANMSTGSPFTPNNDTTVGYVRRTPRSKDALSTPNGRSTKRKDFVSPIDKLLIKNGSMAESNMLPLDENEIFKKIEVRKVEEEAIDTKPEEHVKNSDNSLEINEINFETSEEIKVVMLMEKDSVAIEDDKIDCETEVLTKESEIEDSSCHEKEIRESDENMEVSVNDKQPEDSLEEDGNEIETNFDENSNETQGKIKRVIKSKISEESKERAEDMEVSASPKETKDSLKQNENEIKQNFDENSNETQEKMNRVIKSKKSEESKASEEDMEVSASSKEIKDSLRQNGYEIKTSIEENSNETQGKINRVIKSKKSEESPYLEQETKEREDMEVSLSPKEIKDSLKQNENEIKQNFDENSNETQSKINRVIKSNKSEESKEKEEDMEVSVSPKEIKDSLRQYKNEIKTNFDENSNETQGKNNRIVKSNKSEESKEKEEDMEVSVSPEEIKDSLRQNKNEIKTNFDENSNETQGRSNRVLKSNKSKESPKEREDMKVSLIPKEIKDSLKQNVLKSKESLKGVEEIKDSLRQNENDIKTSFDENSNVTPVKSKRDAKSKRCKVILNRLESSNVTDVSSNHEKETSDAIEISSSENLDLSNQKETEQTSNQKEISDEGEVSTNHDKNSNELKVNTNPSEEIVNESEMLFDYDKDNSENIEDLLKNDEEKPGLIKGNSDLIKENSDLIKKNSGLIKENPGSIKGSSLHKETVVEISSSDEENTGESVEENFDPSGRKHKEKSDETNASLSQKQNSNGTENNLKYEKSTDETKLNFNNLEENTDEVKTNSKHKENADQTEVNLNIDDDVEMISIAYKTEVSSKSHDAAEEIKVISNHDDKNIEITSNHELAKDPEQINQVHIKNEPELEDAIKIDVSLVNASNVESPDLPAVEEQNERNLVKLEVDSIETLSNTEFADGSTSAKSPSAISMDSAKGSSIVNEDSWMSFSTGDLYWGQIYNFCYWPCLVCPDPKGKTITTEEHGRSGDQHVMVHVRFFADNARRNWIKRENLMPFMGLENYQERLEEAKEKYGAKSAKMKLYIPTKKKEAVWRDAVKEANEVSEVPYADRLEKFYEIFEKSKVINKLKNQRRKSMYLPTHRGSTSDIESFYGSNDNINSLNMPSNKQKRERSISPYSPAYSPIKSVKRRKLSSDQQQELPSTSAAAAAAASNNTTADHNHHNSELNLSQSSSVASSSTPPTLSDLDIFNNLEFKGLYLVMKDYCLKQNHHEKLEKSLLAAARNIYAIKQLSEQIEQRRLRDSLTGDDLNDNSLIRQTEGAEGSLKRLSTRLRTLKRKSLLSQHQQPLKFETPERSMVPVKDVKESSSTSTVDKIKKPLADLNRPILEVIDDIFELDNKYLFKGMSRDPVCKYCFKPGGNLARCAKNCNYYLHNECLHIDFAANGKVKRIAKRANSAKSNNDVVDGNTSMTMVDLTSDDLNEKPSAPHVTGDSAEAEVICKECTNKEPVKCMVCKTTESLKEDDPLVKCTMSQCDRAFHPACCKYWPQSKIIISKNHIQSFRCPSHVCHTCVSDDPKGKFQHLTNGKITKCVKCPATYHTDSTCIPAGSQILTAACIICPRHTNTKHDMTVNVNWCFICVGGGQVVCCETCPTAVHAQCLKIPIDPNEGYICEECESGRMPLYGEMVWAKFNNFRWWPAIILPPTEIPTNIAKKTHNPSDFVVRFFGTHDHGWISRRRVYLYLEGDSSEPPKSKSHLDLNYKRGVEEAKEVYEIIKEKKLEQSATNESKEKLHPQPYVRIKSNRAVPPVKLHVDIDSVSKCECDPREENPCGPDTNCLNRCLYHECNPKVCPAGERCQNQMFESRISPRLEVVYMKERGFGLVSREPIMAGTFVIEYVGEIIDDNEFQARMEQKSRDRDENFYFLSVEKDYIIDAGPKGNLARFMNHSCDPNCETQKWSVNSLNRVGLFAIKDIPENTELTFNYHWDDLLNNEKKTCYCGAQKCAGQIGAKLKNVEANKESSSSNGLAKTKSKLKTKPVKRLLKGLKVKSESKLKPNVKNKSNKMAAVSAVSALLKTTNNSPSSSTITIEDDAEDDVPLSSKRLESPDLFC